MNKLRLITVMAFVSLTAMSCNDGKKGESNTAAHSDMNNEDSMNDDNMSALHDMVEYSAQNSHAKQVLVDYMALIK